MRWSLYGLLNICIGLVPFLLVVGCMVCGVVMAVSSLFKH